MRTGLLGQLNRVGSGDPNDSRQSVEPLVERQDLPDPMAEHHGRIQRITGRKSRGTQHNVLGLPHILLFYSVSTTTTLSILSGAPAGKVMFTSAPAASTFSGCLPGSASI